METAGNRKRRERKEQFKSYYVVWKLIFGFFNTNLDSGLNRTM